MFSKGSLNAISTGYLNKKRAGQQVDNLINQGTPRSMDLGQSETLDLGQRTSGDSESVAVDPQFVINHAVGVLAEDNKPELVKLLQNTGSFVTPLSSKNSIIDATFQSIRDNDIFRKKLQDYIVEEATNPKPRSQKEGSLIRIAQGSFPKLGIRGRSKAEVLSSNFSSFSDFDSNFSNTDGAGKEKAKKLLGSLASEENLQKLVGLGMSYASTRLNANAQKSTNQQAIEFEKAQTEKALAQAKLEEAKKSVQSNMPTTTESESGKGGKKWVMPVAIGGGVLLLGTIIYFVMKKKK